MSTADGIGPDAAPDPGTEPNVAIVTLSFAAADPAALTAVLARYVVLTRGVEGCTNVDFCAAAGSSTRFVVIEKWSSSQAQRAHLDSEIMVTMAQSCRGLLAEAPTIELLEPISAHDLR
jgi:quinol monooxygenase YgiN